MAHQDGTRGVVPTTALTGGPQDGTRGVVPTTALTGGPQDGTRGVVPTTTLTGGPQEVGLLPVVVQPQLCHQDKTGTERDYLLVFNDL